MKSEDLKVGLVSIAVWGGAFYLMKDLFKPDKIESSGGKGRKTRTRTAISRESLSDDLSEIRNSENSEQPIISHKTPSTTSRMRSSDPTTKFFTSNFNGNDNITDSLSSDIKKYPPHYYKLSKKQQWKFRKQKQIEV